MAKAIPLELGDMHFEKKGDALLVVRRMLQRYAPGERVSADDEALLRALLARHPDAEAKIGCGVDHFMVRSAMYGKQCFWVVRTDETTEDFSYQKCI